MDNSSKIGITYVGLLAAELGAGYLSNINNNDPTLLYYSTVGLTVPGFVYSLSDGSKKNKFFSTFSYLTILQSVLNLANGEYYTSIFNTSDPKLILTFLAGTTIVTCIDAIMERKNSLDELINP